MGHKDTSLGGDQRAIPSTDRLRVVLAGDVNQKAVGALLEDYWKPVYYFLRENPQYVEPRQFLEEVQLGQGPQLDFVP